MKRSKQQGPEELQVRLSPEVMAVLDDFARAQGLSRADAVRAALFCCPSVVRVLAHGPVSFRDVLGP